MAKVSQLKTRNQEYWDGRAEWIARRGFAKGDAMEREMAKLFRSAYNDLDAEIQQFYTKYGVITESPIFKTLADGTKVPTGTAQKLVVPANVANKKLTRLTRLEKLEASMRQVLLDNSKQQNLLMQAGLSEIAENAFYDQMFATYQGVGIGSSFNLLSDTTVRSLINNPVNGQSFSTRIWNNRDRLANTINQTLRTGIIQGISNGEMAKRISNNMNSGITVAQRLVRTEVTNSLNQATRLGYNESGIVRQYQYLATLDNRTSEVCEALDGQVFDVDNATTGLNYSPMHVNCRSTTIPYFDQTSKGLQRMARDLGGNTFTVPSDMSTKDFREIYVDKTLTREAWDSRRK